MLDCENRPKKRLRKITKDRLKNIALYYLQRFETTTESLRAVLLRRVNDYAFYNPEFDKTPALQWIEEILSDFQRYKYVDDARFAALKIRDYLAVGKSEKYIRLKMALKLAKKKHIGPFRQGEDKADFYQKDLAVLARAGFDYDVAKKVMDFEPES